MSRPQAMSETIRRSIAEIRSQRRRAWAIAAGVLGVVLLSFVAMSPSVRLGTATLVIETEPVGANVRIDGAVIGATPIETDDLLAGEHILRIEHPYRVAYEERISPIRGDVLRRSLTLAPAFGTLVLMTNPRGAWVELNGTRQEAVTPTTFENIAAGNHAIRVGSAEHRPVSLEIEVLPDKSVERVVELHRVLKGHLTIVSVPDDATITLTGLEDGYEDNMRLPLGEYQVRVEREGYASTTLRVGIVQQRNLHRVELEKLYGRLHVESAPANAQLTVTYSVGREIMKLPYSNGMRIPTGVITVHARAMGHRSQAHDIRLGPQGANLKITLTRLDIEPGRTFRDPLRDEGHGPLMVVIGSGTFTMGSEASSASLQERPMHEVSLTEPFAVSVYEITRAQYAAFVRATGVPDTPVVSPEQAQLPAVYVEFAEAEAYAEWLSDMTRERYRLLSEAEWEYVARAGSRDVYFFGDDASEICRYANIADEQTAALFNIWRSAECDDGHAKLAPVGKFEPNAFGVHDILGNAAEWVRDCWHFGYDGAPVDGSAWIKPGACETRVVRGGSWDSRPDDIRSAARYSAADPFGDRGIRVAREL